MALADMVWFRNKYILAGVGSLSIISVAAGYVEFAQHPLTADMETAPVMLASASTSAQTVVVHPILDGIEYVVIPPERLPPPLVS